MQTIEKTVYLNEVRAEMLGRQWTDKTAFTAAPAKLADAFARTACVEDAEAICDLFRPFPSVALRPDLAPGYFVISPTPGYSFHLVVPQTEPATC